jgi:hypothetical protein
MEKRCAFLLPPATREAHSPPRFNELDARMKKPLRVLVLLPLLAAGVALISGCSQAPPLTFTAAPPGPEDLGPATGLSTPAAEAVVFDLKYRAQTGGPDDISYHSFWGYGGPDSETKTNAFLQAVRDKASGRLYYTCNYTLKSRKWSAVEYHGRQASALYFDLNADGRLADHERIPPTRRENDAIEFITPDFTQTLEGGGQTLCRVLLNVRFYEGNSEPNTMWSPAALLEGTATLNGQTTRLLLYANSPGGAFDQYGSSYFSLLAGDRTKPGARAYVPRETLSSMIASEGQFYRLTLDGRRSNGLPARALLVKDTSPTGTMAVRLAGSNSLPTKLASVYLHGVENKTVHFRVNPGKDRVVLPVGTYALANGTLAYGAADAKDWELSFSQGPSATVKADAVCDQTLGHPALKVRAVRESDRWNRETAGTETFKRGTTIYLEPKIVGQGGETLTRFREIAAGKPEKADRPPRITITGPDGKEVLSKTMEYG